MSTLERARKSRSKYLNPIETTVGYLSMLLKLLPLYATNKQETEPTHPLGPFHTDPAAYESVPETGLRVTWFGHSSLLLEMDGVRVLLDPVWDPRAGPSFAGPKRFFPPTLPLTTLPHLDAVVISHDHYDHLGAATVRTLTASRPRMRWICPLGVGRLLGGFGVPASRVTELDWTQSTLISAKSGAELTLTALPARHFSGRAPWNRFRTLWASYALTGARHKVYFGADSGLWNGFEAIGREHGPFDLTMLEIGAFHPLWKSIHMGPDGAAEAFAALGGGVLMPIHWGLFNLALHGWRQPIERMAELASERQMELFSPTPGLPTSFTGEEVRSNWWRE